MTVIWCSNKNTETPTQSSLPGFEILTCQGPLIFRDRSGLSPGRAVGGAQSRADHADTTTQACDLFLSIAGGLHGICDYHQDVVKCLHFQEKQKRNHSAFISVFP